MTSPSPIEVLHTAQPGPFRTLGEQLLAIVRAATGAVDDRLRQVRAASGGSELDPGSGGFLLQPEFSRAIVERMYDTGYIHSRCFDIPIKTSNAIAFPQFFETSRASGSRLGGVQCFWENEADTLVASKPAFMLSELTTKKLTGLIYATDELVAETDALNTWVSYAFAQESTFVLENAIVNGTGSGQPLGVMNSPALITVAKEGGQAAGSIVANNVINMVARLWAPSSKNAIWIYDQGTVFAQLAKLTTVAGAAGSESKLFQYGSYGVDGANTPNMLAGMPAYPSEYCQVVGTPGDLILCDFSRYIVATRQPVRTDISIHVLFLSDQSAFRVIMRVDGQPIDVAPVTPFNGSATTSPFVALAARA